MIKSIAVVYILFYLTIMGIGYSVYKKITDFSDPSSLASRMKKLERLNENP